MKDAGNTTCALRAEDQPAQLRCASLFPLARRPTQTGVARAGDWWIVELLNVNGILLDALLPRGAERFHHG